MNPDLSARAGAVLRVPVVVDSLGIGNRGDEFPAEVDRAETWDDLPDWVREIILAGEEAGHD